MGSVANDPSTDRPSSQPDLVPSTLPENTLSNNAEPNVANTVSDSSGFTAEGVTEAQEEEKERHRDAEKSSDENDEFKEQFQYSAANQPPDESMFDNIQKCSKKEDTSSRNTGVKGADETLNSNAFQPMSAPDAVHGFLDHIQSFPESHSPRSSRFYSGIPGAHAVQTINPNRPSTRPYTVPGTSTSREVNTQVIPNQSESLESEGLVKAVALHDDEEIDEETLQQAVPEKSSETLPNRHCRLALLLAVLFLVVVSAISGTFATRRRQETTQTPTAAPTSYRSALEEEVKSQLLLELGTNYLDLNHSNHKQRLEAFYWILLDDPLQLEAGAPNLVQRYVMALLYFMTTKDHPWRFCNPPFGNQGSTCFYKDTIYSDDDEILGTSWLSETSECLWAGVICSNRTVTSLNLPDFGLNGPIPTEFSTFTSLSTLLLPENSLTGSIPSELTSLPLTWLNLKGNKLVGTIPVDFFRGNGTLEQLTLIRNSLTGTIPSSVGQYSGTYLSIDGNSFTGTIPTELFQMKNIFHIGIGSMQMTGTIPTEIGTLSSSLKSLRIRDSSLSGTIPTEIGKLDLIELMFENLNTNGTVPEELYTGLKNIRHLHIVRCGLTGTISTKLELLSDLAELVLSGNDFHGSIPSEISLLSLLTVHLDGSGLTGTIPESFCKNANREAGATKVFVADCLPNKKTGLPLMQCPCCTACCDSSIAVCIDM